MLVNGVHGHAWAKSPLDRLGASARPCGLTVDEAGSIVVADSDNNAIRTVSLAGQIHTLAGTEEAGFADEQGAMARFNEPLSRMPCSAAFQAGGWPGGLPTISAIKPLTLKASSRLRVRDPSYMLGAR